MHSRIITATLFLAIATGALADAAPDFTTAVQPILAKHCFDCHGNGHRKGGLTLDSQQAALQGGDSLHPAYTPGNSATSELITRITATDPAKRMPPKGDPLTPEEINTLRTWIDTGATWGGDAALTTTAAIPGADHWSFKAPHQAAPPSVQHTDWPRNPIDNFVLARIEAAGLAPAPEADRYTLARRAYLDLTGLPPSPEQLNTFVNDPRPDAYEHLVDTLLASPHYGERMAVSWLDIAHYADTNGFEKDRPRSIWPYRDWVINAYNKNMPYDRFIIEQYAGDLLPNPTQDQRIATGFLRNTMINEEGGVDQEEYRFEAINDRVATTGMAFLGLTLNCAQCHTHKFDPITQREYYQFYAFLNNADEVEMPVISDKITREREAAQREIDTAVAKLESQFPIDPALLTTTTLKPSQANAQSGTTLNTNPDDTITADGTPADKDTYILLFEAPKGTYTGLRLEALTTDTNKAPGRADNGNFVLSEITARLFPTDAPPRDLAFVRAEADASQDTFPIAHAIDGKKDTGWAIDIKGEGTNHPRTATFTFDAPLDLTEPTTTLGINLDQQFGGKHLLGKFRLSLLAENLPNGEAAARADHLARRFNSWREETKAKAVPWTPLEVTAATSKNHVTFLKQDDLSLLVAGDNPNTDTYTISCRTDLQGITALRLEVLPDPSLPGGGPGRGIIMTPNEGDFLLSEIAATAAPWADPATETPITLQNPTQDYAAPTKDTTKALDGKLDTGWSIAGAEGQPHAAVFPFAAPIGHQGGTLLKLTLDQYYVHLHTIGRLRISVTTTPEPVASGVPAEIEAELLRPAPNIELLKRHYLGIAPELAPQHKQLAAMRKAMPKYPTTLVLQEREIPRTTRIHHRGEFLAERDPVDANVPAILPPLPPGVPKNRLTLARWLASPENPLTPRTAVNRVWQQLFGRGFVNTTEDFGLRGDKPTHPELLDWLAVEFVRRGWDMKDLIRLITTSATYRQDSRVTPQLIEKDPTNELLARGPRFRVDGEFIRDIALTASGLLHDAQGGPSVYPPLPEGMLDLVYASGAWKPSEGPDKYRRALYTFWKRTMPYPTAITYDCPARDVAVVKRVRSNTPLQALTQLNNPVFLEAAQHMAQRVLKEATTTPDRIHLAYLLTINRPPDPIEQATTLNFLTTQQTRFQNGTLDPTALAGQPNPELAAWTALCRALLNLDETITRS